MVQGILPNSLKDPFSFKKFSFQKKSLSERASERVRLGFFCDTGSEKETLKQDGVWPGKHSFKSNASHRCEGSGRIIQAPRFLPHSGSSCSLPAWRIFQYSVASAWEVREIRYYCPSALSVSRVRRRSAGFGRIRARCPRSVNSNRRKKCQIRERVQWNRLTVSCSICIYAFNSAVALF